VSYTLPNGRICIMGVLNVTPDSFSDGGQYTALDSAISRAREMVAQGADIIDVGGESTRPGAVVVDKETEAARVIPVVAALAKENVVVSIDTRKPEVAKAALASGANIVNDISGMRSAEMRMAAAEANAAVCIMHMQGEPETMQQEPRYDNVVHQVTEFLGEQARLCRADGIKEVWVDPGIGFGKNLEHNLELLRGIPALASLGYPVVVGVSRKSFIGRLTSRKEPSLRLPGSLAAGLFAVLGGARVLRVHDVAETVEAIAVWSALVPPRATVPH
jgi:dihydropteroate synthase